MDRADYSDSISSFAVTDAARIVGQLAAKAGKRGLPATEDQLNAWSEEVEFLQDVLKDKDGAVYFEYSIPRMGRRIDVVLLIGPAILVVEFKVGQSRFERAAIDQVWDYALDLRNFHETSHVPLIAPILVATAARDPGPVKMESRFGDDLLDPMRANTDTFGAVVGSVLSYATGGRLDPRLWESGRYRPTPTIIEAAKALYGTHSVAEISRSDAEAINLTKTSDRISSIINSARSSSRKVICFVTGVPGAGKTLVGLNVATTYMDVKDDLHSVYLSGNGPLVKVLCEALARDQVTRSAEAGKKVAKGEARSKVKAFIQNVHHFRDECIRDDGPPPEHVAIFDEAQRAWTKDQTSSFMRRKKGKHGFSMSEPEYLISCLDRHADWAVVVCLVGGGQEINTGEAGIGEWIDSLERSHQGWDIHISPRLTDSEYGAGIVLDRLRSRSRVDFRDELHLSTSMRSFRAENISQLVKQLLDIEVDEARKSLASATKYPIALTRDLATAKAWLKKKARGTERYGLVASSQAERLKPHAISVKAPVDPVHYFLDDKDDVRSSYYLEDVATEFHVQGLELDWTGVVWDADLRYNGKDWDHWSFHGNKWKQIKKVQRQRYLENAYRVLLTRARQGMVIVVPEGDPEDPTRKASFYDRTYDYLGGVGFELL